MSRSAPMVFQLDPDKRQRTLLARYVGVSRYAYNWVLYRARADTLTGEDLVSAFREAAATDAPWIGQVPEAITLGALREAERDLAAAKRGKGPRPRYRRKEDDAAVRIEPGEEGFKLGQGGVMLPEVGRLTLIGTATRIGGSVESIMITRTGDEWRALVRLARAGGPRDRDDARGRDRDRNLPLWQQRATEGGVGDLPESVTLLVDGVPVAGAAVRAPLDEPSVEAAVAMEAPTAPAEPATPEPVATTGWEALSRWIRPGGSDG